MQIPLRTEPGMFGMTSAGSNGPKPAEPERFRRGVEPPVFRPGPTRNQFGDNYIGQTDLSVEIALGTARRTGPTDTARALIQITLWSGHGH